jgi:hypothetical protein
MKNSNFDIPKFEFSLVVRPGFEPRQTVPKTVVLPLYYRTILFQFVILPEIECKCKAKY